MLERVEQRELLFAANQMPWHDGRQSDSLLQNTAYSYHSINVPVHI